MASSKASEAGKRTQDDRAEQSANQNCADDQDIEVASDNAACMREHFRHVRGYTQTWKANAKPAKKKADHDAIVNMVASVLEKEGWAGVDRNSIKVKDTSGHGGNRTYKVSCEEKVTPRCVALHVRNLKEVDDIGERRMAEAWALLQEQDLTPTRWMQGGDWFIEEWGGQTVGPDHLGIRDGITTVEEMAQLLAKIHKIPISWYGKWQQQLRNGNSALQDVPDASHIWWYANRPKLVKKHDASILKMWHEAVPTPSSPHARRVVTCHGDFHTANLLRKIDTNTDDERGKLASIDLEFCFASMAVHDIGWCFHTWCQDHQQKCIFVKAYLEASGVPPPTSEEVEDIILDGEVYMLAFGAGPTFLGIFFLAAFRNDSNFREALHFADIGKRARTDPKLRSAIFKHGLMDCLPWHQQLCHEWFQIIRYPWRFTKDANIGHVLGAWACALFTPFWMLFHFIFYVMVFTCPGRRATYTRCCAKLSLVFNPLRMFGFRMHWYDSPYGTPLLVLIIETMLVVFTVAVVWPYWVVTLLLFSLPVAICRRACRKRPARSHISHVSDKPSDGSP